MRHLWTVWLAAMIPAAAHTAQQSPSQPATNPAMTVTGCIQSGSAAADVGPGGRSAGAAHYVLAKAATSTPGGAAPSAAPPRSAAAGTPEPGAVGTSGAPVAVSSYVLHGQDEEIAKHVGHRVEIVGMASQAAPAGDAKGQPQPQVIPHEPHRGAVDVSRPAGSPSDGQATAHPSVQHMTVVSVKMIAANCQ